MDEILPKVVIAGLAASVSPVAIMVLISVMFARNALRNALVFLAGYTSAMVALGVIGVFILHLGGSGKKSEVDAYIDIAAGVLCLLAILLVLRKKKTPEKKEDYGGLGPAKVLALGFVTMLVNSSTIICYLSGAHAVSAAGVDTADKLLGLAVLTAVSLVTLVVPIVFYAVFPRRAKKALGELKGWLSRHSRAISVVVLAAFGVYLIVKGITAVA